MGVMNGLTRAFLGKPRGASDLSSRSGSAPALTLTSPVVVDWSSDRDDDAASTTRGERRREAKSPASRTTKQEALEELRDISDQVLGLVRKVDTHLDTQADRQERLLELAGQTARSNAALDSIDQRHGELNETVRRLALAADAHRSRELEMLDRQQETLAGIQRMVDRTGASELRIAGSLEQMDDTMRHVRESNRSLGEALVELRTGDLRREAMLTAQMRRSTRLAAGAMAAACVLVVLTVAALTLTTLGAL